MLIRLVSHAHKKNPNTIDELIRIDGLPESLLFRVKEGRKYLREPWEADPDVNIPFHIREHCERVDISIDLPAEKNEVTGVMQRPVDTRTILGVRLMLDSNPGKEIWSQIERILELETPRDRPVPTPRVVAPNHKDPFYLEAKDIPVADLRKSAVEKPPEPVAIVAPVPQPVVAPINPQIYTCGVCQKAFTAQRGLWMHERKTRHKVKEPVEV